MYWIVDGKCSQFLIFHKSVDSFLLPTALTVDLYMWKYYSCKILNVFVPISFIQQIMFLFQSMIECFCLRIKKICLLTKKPKFLSVLNNSSIPSKHTFYPQSIGVTYCPERDNLPSDVSNRLSFLSVSPSLLCLQWHPQTKRLYSITVWWVVTWCYSTELLY